MKITGVEAVPFKTIFERPFRSRYASRQSFDHVIVRITTDEGIFGIGEASPLTHFTGETQQCIIHMIKNQLSPLLIGEDPERIGWLIHKMDNLPWNPASKTALDMALHDLAGKAIGVPVYKLLGGLSREEIPLAEAIGSIDPEEAAKRAVELVDEGFTVLKVKIGFNPHIDVRIVETVREAVGSDVVLWFDANASYRPKIALKVIRKIERYEPFCIEQPVGPREDLKGMAEVRRSTDIPIMADESVLTPSDALSIVEKGAADMLAIKFVKCGGLFNAKRIATIAETAGLPCMMISTYGTGLCISANAHVAASTENIIFCNMREPNKSENWIKTGLVRERDKLRVSSQEGLGIKLLEDVFAQQ
jgi:L-alanine-DL-glutamate epimerase-like enolase superfamily enzyme